MESSINDRILNRVRGDIKKSKLTEDLNRILSLNEREFSFLIDEIIRLEGKAIGDAFKNRESIIIPALGTFKYKKAKELAQPFIKDILKKHNVRSFADMANLPSKKEIFDEVNSIKGKIAYDLKMETHSPRRPIIPNGFKVKR